MAQFQVGQRADSILERGGKRLHPSDTSVGAGHVRQSQQSAERLEGRSGHTVQCGGGTMACRPTADGAVARIDSACADAGIRTVCGNRNAGIASVCAVAAGTSDAIKAIAGANKKWSPRPLWETDSTYSFLLMPLGFAKPLDQ